MTDATEQVVWTLLITAWIVLDVLILMTSVLRGRQ